jgi:hypothetical protein
LEFKAENNAYIGRKQALESKMSEAFAFLWEQYHIAMQKNIKARTAYESTIKGNPIG